MLPPFALHGDVLSLIAVLAVSYWYLETRIRPVSAPAADPATGRQWWSWYSGLAVMLFASGWPMHDLAEESLFTAHMLEHMLIGYVVPPLLLLGMTRWMADITLGKAAPLLRRVAKPVVGFFAFNTALVAIHWPAAVEWQNETEWAHFLIHLAFFATAILMWLPVFSPTPAVPRAGAPMRMVYLFLNTIIPTVPASFITFSNVPLYPVYGDAASAWGLTAVADQTIAGIVMKLGGGFYLLAIIAAIWFRWIKDERRWDVIERDMAANERVTS